MKTVFEFGGVNFFRDAKYPALITALQSESGRRLFTVAYGLQVKQGLTYEQACREIGICVLHLQCCNGIASNEEIGRAHV